MSVSYNAKVMVGLPYDQLPVEWQDFDKLDELFNDGVEVVAPYYDASTCESLVGFTIQDSGEYSYTEFDVDHMVIAALRRTFVEQFGAEPKVYVTTHSW